MDLAKKFHTTRICEEAKSRKTYVVCRIQNSENYFSIDNIFFDIARNFLELLSDDADSDQEKHVKFLRVSLSFQNASFLYLWKYFPPDNDVLKNARILNAHKQMCSFKSV